MPKLAWKLKKLNNFFSNDCRSVSIISDFHKMLIKEAQIQFFLMYFHVTVSNNKRRRSQVLYEKAALKKFAKFVGYNYDRVISQITLIYLYT